MLLSGEGRFHSENTVGGVADRKGPDDGRGEGDMEESGDSVAEDSGGCEVEYCHRFTTDRDADRAKALDHHL